MLKSMRKRTKPILWAVIVAFVGTIFLVWGMRYSARRSGLFYARVNGREITPREIREKLERYIDMYRRYGVEYDEEVLRKRALRDLIEERLMFDEACRMGVRVSDKEVLDLVQSWFVNDDGRFDEKAYARFLERTPISRQEKIKEGAKQGLMIEEVKRRFTGSMFISESELWHRYRMRYRKASLRHILIRPSRLVSDEALKRYYEEHPDEFMTKEEVRARHILIKTGEGKRSDDEAREKIEEILRQIKAGGDFSSLAREFSECPSGKKGGDLGFFPRGKMAKEFEEVAFSMEAGEVSDVVKTKFGYHIIVLDERKEPQLKPLEEVKEEVRKKICESGQVEELAKKRAEELWRKIMEGGDFEALARESSHGETAKEGGFLGVIPKTPDSKAERDLIKKLKDEVSNGWRIDQEFEKVAFSLEPGEVSDVVRSEYGFHIIRCEEVFFPERDGFEKKKDLLLRELKSKKQAEWIKYLKAQAKIEIGKDPEGKPWLDEI